ncbi:MAG: hypothetical protein WC619_02210 [Patescibacteria group bacterium]
MSKLINYRDIPVEKWSKSLNIKWSFDLKNQVYDRYREEAYYDDGTQFIAGWVNMDVFFHSIPKLHQLKGNDIWKYRNVNKINGAINFWKKGGKMTPPIIDTLVNYSKSARLPILKIKDGIIIRAGFHRFSVCCLVNLDEMPFFTPVESQKDVEAKLGVVRWV